MNDFWNTELPLWPCLLAILSVACLVDWALARRDLRRRQRPATLTWGGVIRARAGMAKPAVPLQIVPWMIHRNAPELEMMGFDTVEPGIRMVGSESAIVNCLMGHRTATEAA
jgi:hypothetical protein